MAQQNSVEWLINHWKKLQSKGEKMSWNQIIAITELTKELHKKDCIRFSIEWENKRDDEDIKSKEDLYDLIYNKQEHGTNIGRLVNK